MRRRLWLDEESFKATRSVDGLVCLGLWLGYIGTLGRRDVVAVFVADRVGRVGFVVMQPMGIVVRTVEYAVRIVFHCLHDGVEHGAWQSREDRVVCLACIGDRYCLARHVRSRQSALGPVHSHPQSDFCFHGAIQTLNSRAAFTISCISCTHASTMLDIGLQRAMIP